MTNRVNFSKTSIRDQLIAADKKVREGHGGPPIEIHDPKCPVILIGEREVCRCSGRGYWVSWDK